MKRENTEKIGVVGFLFVVSMAIAQIAPWTVKEHWQSLAPKLTEQAVFELLGHPKDKEDYNGILVYYYQEIPERQGNQLVSRPRQGFVRFRQSPEQVWLLYSWQEPDWTTVASHTESQYLAEQRRIEQQTEAEEARRLREEQQRLRMVEAERLQAERLAQAERQRQEVARLRAERQVHYSSETNNTSQNQPVSTAKPKSDYSLQNVHTKYWFSVAGIFILMAIVIGVTFGFKR